jgi:uncharacterized protein YgiM (DUF1202 family)
MSSTTVVVGRALFAGVWLSLVLAGCGGSQMPQPDAPSAGTSSQLSPNMPEKQLDQLLVKVSQLQLASQESLAAAKAIGTSEQALIAVQQDYAAAEQLLREGQEAYRARQYEVGWDRLRAADAAFRRVEEAAVRAGLGQLEQELATQYGRFLTSDPHSASRIGRAVRVSQGSVNLREGAGLQFQVIGRAQPTDKLTILAEGGEWYQVRTGTGLVGWVSKVLVTQVQSP